MFNRVTRVDRFIEIKQAIITVFDKKGLAELTRGLLTHCPETRVYSTGGTHDYLTEILTAANHERLRLLRDYTGQPEMAGGLVKTLDFKLYLGLLSETHNPEHQARLDSVQAAPFDLVVVNLYPFAKAVAASADCETARGHMDIGGVCLLRAAAKNFLRVTALSDPNDYKLLLDELKQNRGRVSFAFRYRMAVKTLALVADYDAQIADYFQTLNTAAIDSYEFEPGQK